MVKLGKGIPSGWQEQGSSTQVLEEGQFWWETTGGTQPKDWQGCGKLTWPGYNRAHLSDFDGAMLIYTDFFFFAIAYQKGYSCKRDAETEGTVRLSPTCSRSSQGANLNCWVNSHPLWSTSVHRGGSILQFFVFIVKMFLVMQINFYGRFCNLRSMQVTHSRKEAVERISCTVPLNLMARS